MYNRLWVQPVKQAGLGDCLRRFAWLVGAGLIYGPGVDKPLASRSLQRNFTCYRGWSFLADLAGGYQRAWVTLAAGASAFADFGVGAAVHLAAPQFTAKEIAEDFKANYDGASSVYVIAFLRPGFCLLYRCFYRGHKHYFVPQQSGYAGSFT